MLNIAICDDEKQLRRKLKSAVVTELELKAVDVQISEFADGEELLAAIIRTDFDIIFLDIEMPKLNGIEAAKKLRANAQKGVIIFVTAYPDFVFQGYEVHALNYILKPCENRRIIQVLNDALTELNENKDKFYAVETKGGVYKLNLSETYYFSSDKRKINAIIKGDIIDFYGKLDDLATELPDFFIRIHQRYLVNLNYVNEVENSIAIVNGDKLPVSRNRHHDLMVGFAKTMLR